MKLFHTLSLLLSLFALADTPPVDPDIELPVGPVIPTPMPMPPSGVYTLNDGENFVIPCKVKCRVKAWPSNLVTVNQKTGPRDITGKFAGGKGADEDRTFTKPFLYVVKANPGVKGSVTIEICPYGFADDSKIVTTTIDVNGGQPPAPDPKPSPQPGPDPKPSPAKLWGVVIIEDTAAAVAERGQMLASKPLASLLKERGYKFRVVDKDVTGPDGQPPTDVKRFLASSQGKPLPQAFLVDAKGIVVTQFALGTTDPAETLVDNLKKWGQ